MKYFIDTEFIEGFWNAVFYKPRHFIDLISIGIIAEDGREYYAISNEFNPKNADDWVKENVISKLVPQNTYSSRNGGGFVWRNNSMIANDIQGFVAGDSNIEFYGYYADYDWVLLCSLFGRMIDLPKGFPMYCRDLKQSLDEKCISLKETPETIRELNGFPKQVNEHNALADAKWNYELYKFLTN